MSEIKISRLFPENCITIFDLQDWLKCASSKKQDEWISNLDYNSIMAASREYDKNIGQLIEAGTGGIQEQIYSPLLSSLVGAASRWSFLRDGKERPIEEIIREQLKHENLI